MNLRRAWIVGVVGYSVLRAIIAWGLFSDYGVNPWIFAVIDIGTAIPYAWSIAALPAAIVAMRPLQIVATMSAALTTFFAPYVYIWVSVDGAPANLRSGLVILVLCLLGASVVGVARRTRGGEVTIDLSQESPSTETKVQAHNSKG